MSEDIRLVVEASTQRIADEFADFPWENPTAYADWLAQSYYYVRYVPTALVRAVERCGPGSAVHPAFVAGASEERGHDQLLLADLRHLGRHLDEFPESSEAAAYHQSLFADIENEGAVSLLGYAIPLEGVAALKMADHLRRLRALYSDVGTHFLRVHCELDTEHLEHGLALLTTLSRAESEIVRQSIHTSTQLYVELLAQLKARYQVREAPTPSLTNQ